MRLLIQITTYVNIPPLQERSRCQWGWKLFFRDVALWKDEISNEKHEKIPRSSDSLFENNPKIFVPPLSPRTPWRGRTDNWKSSRNFGHTFTCTSLLKRPICTYAFSEKRGFSFAPIINAVSFSFTTVKKQCRCLITLMHCDDIQFPSTPFQSPAASR